mmetsp:Transcript_17709/g.52575  ORF Transcript_17709/g.52575 Transcript_17709/m.52575 type:complete len:214 (+) Transcript_17709:3659-4300(+)
MMEMSSWIGLLFLRFGVPSLDRNRALSRASAARASFSNCAASRSASRALRSSSSASLRFLRESTRSLAFSRAAITLGFSSTSTFSSFLSVWRMKCMNSSMLTPPDESSSSSFHKPWSSSRLTSCGFSDMPPCEPFARMTRSNSSNSRRSFSSVSMARKTLYQLKWPWYHFFAATLIVRMRFPRSSSIKGAQPSRINKYRPCWNSAMVTSALLS